MSTGQGNRTLPERNVMTLLVMFPGDTSKRRAASMMEDTGIKKKKSLKLEKWVKTRIQNKGNEYA